MNIVSEDEIFEEDFSHLGEFSEDCWSKKTWELCHWFRLSLIIHGSHDVPKQDRGIMH